MGVPGDRTEAEQLEARRRVRDRWELRTDREVHRASTRIVSSTVASSVSASSRNCVWLTTTRKSPPRPVLAVDGAQFAPRDDSHALDGALMELDPLAAVHHVDVLVGHAGHVTRGQTVGTQFALVRARRPMQDARQEHHRRRGALAERQLLGRRDVVVVTGSQRVAEEVAAVEHSELLRRRCADRGQQPLLDGVDAHGCTTTRPTASPLVRRSHAPRGRRARSVPVRGRRDRTPATARGAERACGPALRARCRSRARVERR